MLDSFLFFSFIYPDMEPQGDPTLTRTDLKQDCTTSYGGLGTLAGFPSHGERTYWEKWIFSFFSKTHQGRPVLPLPLANATRTQGDVDHHFPFPYLSRDTPSPRMSELNSYARGSHTRTRQTQQQQQRRRREWKHVGSGNIGSSLIRRHGSKICISAGAGGGKIPRENTKDC